MRIKLNLSIDILKYFSSLYLELVFMIMHPSQVTSNRKKEKKSVIVWIQPFLEITFGQRTQSITSQCMNLYS